MNRYPIDARTIKTIDQFSYDTYSAISVNMLKYNHDTSASIRLLSTLINTSREVMEDLPYQISFNLKGLDFISIDRMNAFYWPNIAGFVVDDNEDTNCLAGYSRYTDKTYLLRRIDKQSDFVRHSLPADMFFSGAVFPGIKVPLTLSPYIKLRTDFEIKDSQITIKPYMGFVTLNLDSQSPVKITVSGVDVRGNEKSEEINIVAEINYVTETEWKLVTSVMASNTSASVTVLFYPYIAGDCVLSSSLIIDREQLEPSICILTVDKARHNLVYNILRENMAEYPLKYDILKTVPLDIDKTHKIFTEYIDEPNKLLYAVHAKGTTVPSVTTQLPAPFFREWKSWQDTTSVFSMDPSYGDSGWQTDGTVIYNNGDSGQSVFINIAPGFVVPEYICINWVTQDPSCLSADIEFTWSGGNTSSANGYMTGNRIDFNTGSTGQTLTGISLSWSSSPIGIVIYDINFLMDSGVNDWTRTYASLDTRYAFDIGRLGSRTARSLYVPPEQWYSNNVAITMPTYGGGGYGFGGASQTINGQDISLFIMPINTTDDESEIVVGIDSSGYDSLQAHLWNSLTIDVRNTDVMPYVLVRDLDGGVVSDWKKWDGSSKFAFTDSFIGQVEFGWDVAELSVAYDLDFNDYNNQTLSVFAPAVTLMQFEYIYPVLTNTTPETTAYTEHSFSCFPLVIPTTPDNTFDADKTAYQALSVEYEEDCINEEWNMWLFPTSKTNDVETCNIYINGQVYMSEILLDLYRYGIDTNRITIPFSDIYTDTISSAIVEIRTYGIQESYTKFALDRTILKPLYTKSLDDYLRRFKDNPDSGTWTVPTLRSTNKSYPSGDLYGWGDGKYGGITEEIPPKPFGFGGMQDINYANLYDIYKLSSAANVAINGQKIVNIFDSFYADEDTKMVVTSDTITHIKGISCTPVANFLVESQEPTTILGSSGALRINFSSAANPATVTWDNLSIKAPAPHKIQNPKIGTNGGPQ